VAIQKATGQVIGNLEVDSSNIASNAVTPNKLADSITIYDSATATAFIDSDYIALRTTAGTDSAAIISLIDSDYVSARSGTGSTYDVFWENSQTLATSHTIAAGRSAMSAGPITINNGVTVTIDSDSRWVIM